MGDILVLVFELKTVLNFAHTNKILKAHELPPSFE